MALSNNSSDSGIEEEFELLRIKREGEERRKLLQNALKDCELFDMSKDDFRGVENEEVEEESIEEDINPLFLPGIKFFNCHQNCEFNQDSIKTEITLLKNYSNLDFQTLMELKDKVLFVYVIESSIERRQLFSSLFKLLFTRQTQSYLEEVCEILLFLAERPNEAYPLLKIMLDTFPVGIKNLGGNVSKIIESEKFQNISSEDVNDGIEDKNLYLVHNIRYAVDMLQYTLKKASIYLKGKLHLHSDTVDDLVVLLIVVSQDPAILRSCAVPSVQNCLAEILDIYPSDCAYLKKIQDIVERIALYWADSVEGFSHTSAYITCCDIIPLSIRGKKLKSSLAYCSLVYCLPDYEVEIVDKVTLCNLSKFCKENIEAFSCLDFHTLYSIMRLIDAAISRPVAVHRDEEYIKSLVATINVISCQKSGDVMEEGEGEFYSLVIQLKSQWNKLIEPRPEARNLF